MNTVELCVKHRVFLVFCNFVSCFTLSQDRIEKDMEARGHDLIEILSKQLPSENERNKGDLTVASVLLEIRTIQPPNTNTALTLPLREIVQASDSVLGRLTKVDVRYLQQSSFIVC